jgi:hypothetical protein
LNRDNGEDPRLAAPDYTAEVNATEPPKAPFQHKSSST